MADIRDWAAFIRGRWNWSAYGYEDGFPRGCQFTDLDAGTEFDGRSLDIETKAWDGLGIVPSIYGDNDKGQRLFLRNEAKLGKTVFVVYGCGCCNNPYAMHRLGVTRSEDRFLDWREYDLEQRRKNLKHEIDQAMGLLG